MKATKACYHPKEQVIILRFLISLVLGVYTLQLSKYTNKIALLLRDIFIWINRPSGKITTCLKHTRVSYTVLCEKAFSSLTILVLWHACRQYDAGFRSGSVLCTGSTVSQIHSTHHFRYLSLRDSYTNTFILMSTKYSEWGFVVIRYLSCEHQTLVLRMAYIRKRSQRLPMQNLSTIPFRYDNDLDYFGDNFVVVRLY